MLLALLATAANSSMVRAADDGPQFGWREVWAGTDASHDVWLLYTGITVAPWSKDIYTDGFRLRAASGYGQYSYAVKKHKVDPCGGALELPKRVPCEFEWTSYKADLTYSDALIGYHQRFGDLTAKAFIGVSVVDHAIHPRDRGNRALGVEFGVKGALEFWLNIGSDAWTSLDLAYSTAHDTASARWRLGYRALPTVSIGPEARFDSNAEDHAGRAGLFARYEWLGGEISVAAGASGDMTGGITHGVQPYATLNVLFQY